MARTNQERFDEAVKYIKDKIDAGLAAEVQQKITAQPGVTKDLAGAELSLKGHGFHFSSNDKNMALRGLMLCQMAYFRPPHAQFNYCDNDVLDATRLACKGKTEALIQADIRLYLKKPIRHLADVADAAKRVKKVEGVVDAVHRQIADDNVSKAPVCYHGVSAWLFAAGMVSKRWYAREGLKIDGNTANQQLGQGVTVKESDWGAIPEGYVWNIHRTNDPTTCHWGVSLGNGIAAACNNTDSSPGLPPLNYIVGNTAYGQFNFVELCNILNANAKYGGSTAKNTGNIVVKKINPMNEAALY
ncbi:hypothetical protein [Piscinibacter sakaiensis]|uniref:hypothetical protein n=1 Tax=Piscinibacter sakaiensis TaxID=1547922 RepID=UPI003AB036D1